jgi:hypothetical protein
MELDPELQFKHYTAAEAKLAAEVLMRVPALTLPNIEICCDLEHHVFYSEHTNPELAAALGGGGDWLEIREWAQRKRAQPQGS